MNERHAATANVSGLERTASMPTGRSEEAKEDVRDEANDEDDVDDVDDDAPRLCEYPSLERLGMYDEDYLVTDGILVLVRPPKTVHVWIGAGATLGVKIRMCSGVARGRSARRVGLRRRASGARGAGRRGERGVLGRVRGGTVNRGSMTAEGRMTRCVARSFASVPYFVHVKREPIGARLFFSRQPLAAAAAAAPRNPPKLLVCVQTPCRRRAVVVPMNAGGAHPRRPESPEALAGVGARDRSRRASMGVSAPTQDVRLPTEKTRDLDAYARKPSLPPLVLAVRMRFWRTLPSAPISLQKSVITCARLWGIGARSSAPCLSLNR